MCCGGGGEGVSVCVCDGGGQCVGVGVEGGADVSVK